MYKKKEKKAFHRENNVILLDVLENKDKEETEHKIS